MNKWDIYREQRRTLINSYVKAVQAYVRRRNLAIMIKATALYKQTLAKVKLLAKQRHQNNMLKFHAGVIIAVFSRAVKRRYPGKRRAL